MVKKIMQLHRKQKIVQDEPQWKLGFNVGAPLLSGMGRKLLIH